jgi:hypothetical protein
MAKRKAINHTLECCKCHTAPRSGNTAYCKSCNNSYSNSYNRRNPDKVKQYSKKSQSKRAVRQWELVVAYLRSHPCMDCGESNIVLLEFDHVRGIKKCSIGSLINGSQADKTILDEIAKCDVVCVKCHRLRTVRRAIENPATTNGRRWSGGRYAHLTPEELIAVGVQISVSPDISQDVPALEPLPNP